MKRRRRIAIRQRPRRGVENPVDCLRVRPSGEGRTAREHRVEDAAEAEQVGSAIDSFTANLFGGHVGGRADGSAGRGQLGDVEGHAGQAEIGQPDAGSTLVQHHVAGLHIAMDDALGVSRCQA